MRLLLSAPIHPLAFALSALLASACAPENGSPPVVVAAPAASVAATATCPATWTTPPALSASLAPPDASSLRVITRLAAKGTQNYQCTASSADGGSAFGWTFLGPEATLADCSGAAAGRHLASNGGAGAPSSPASPAPPASPKWEAVDGSFVIAKKLAAEPAKEPGAVPWLLLQVTSNGGAGALSGVSYVQRTATSGGAMPATGCDAAHVGTVAKVPYSADYWFLGHAP